jgi:hypothetical protein
VGVLPNAMPKLGGSAASRARCYAIRRSGFFLGHVFGTAFPFGTMFLSVANFKYPM